MREIRLRWKDHVSHADHEVGAHGRWARASAESRRDLEIIVRTANELYGPRSHWIEEREARQPDRKARLRFDERVLQCEAAAGPYARQLMAGFFWLRFAMPLERDYADHVHDAQRRGAAMFGWLALALWLGWAGASADAAVPAAAWWARGAVALALAAGLCLCVSRRVFVSTDVVAFTLVLPLLAVTVMQALLAPSAGFTHGRSAAVLVIVTAFFPVGLRWRQSVGAVLVTGAACTLAALAWLPVERTGATLGTAALLLATAALSAVGAYFREHADREQFLLHELLSRQAYIDPLTGLQNRRGTDHLTQVARLQAIRDGVNVSFVAVEIDQADRAPTEVTQTLAAFARRPLDVASRLAGNTFGLLLYDCDLDQARAHGERLRRALHALPVRHAGGAAGSALATALGVVQLQAEEKAEDFVRRAGRSLEAARRAEAARHTLH